MKNLLILIAICASSQLFAQASTARLSYPIVDTKTETYYSDVTIISEPLEGDEFYGQDANYRGHEPSYTNNGDGTVTDNVTGLTWEKDMGAKMTFDEAFDKAKNSTLGGHSDWRVPTIKELYSLILFTGQVKGAVAIDLFIDTDYFIQPLGNADLDERQIDAQTWSSTVYVGKTMKKNATVFGVNFVDGRIKGYPKFNPRKGADNKMYFRMVRGNVDYGQNNFRDNGDGTVSDLATGLMWQKADDGISRDWEESLANAENLELANYSDWRLPNAKELQSVVDYSRSPQATNSPAIDPVFETTEILDPEGNAGQYPFFWTSTTHLDGRNPYAGAVYVAFGEGQGEMRGTLMDVHGAGCQRSDPKSGDVDAYPQFFGPQGDVRYVYNYVRAVRDIKSTADTEIVSKPDRKAKQTGKKKSNANANQRPSGQQKKNSPPSFSALLTRMDIDKDGKISESEAKGRMKENFDRRDANSDGFLTEDEMQRRSKTVVSTDYNKLHANVPEGGVLSSGTLPDLNAYYDNGEPLKLQELCKGKYTVLAMGCLTCPEFHKAYTGVETTSADYSSEGVQFYYVYKSLRHPELEGYVEAQNLSERLLMVKEVQQKLQTKVPWIVDAMDDNIRIALRCGSQSIYLISPEGEIIKGWGKLVEQDLRQALTDAVGEASTLTTVEDLDLPVLTRNKKRPNEATATTINRPEGMVILKTIAQSPEETYYVKMRVEADAALLKTGNGRLALGFYPDPIHDAKWNNLTPPMKYVLELPDGVTATPQEASAAKGTGDSDIEPRQFWVDISGASASDKIELSLHYYGCTPDFCEALTHKYTILLSPDDTGARTFGFNKGKRNTGKKKSK